MYQLHRSGLIDARDEGDEEKTLTEDKCSTNHN